VSTGGGLRGMLGGSLRSFPSSFSSKSRSVKRQAAKATSRKRALVGIEKNELRDVVRKVKTDQLSRSALWLGSPKPPKPTRTGPPLAAPPELQRVPDLKFPEAVKIGQRSVLAVSLKLPDQFATGDGILSIGVPAGKESVDVTVSVSGPGFDIEGGRERTITVGRKYFASKERASFPLTARPAGGQDREIRVDFWVQNSCIGGASHVVSVRDAARLGKPIQSCLQNATPWPGPASCRSNRTARNAISLFASRERIRPVCRHIVPRPSMA